MITGDWHLTNKTPRNRIDDYPAEQFRKISWMIGECIQRDIKYILQPGDMFDSFNLPDELKSDYIQRWRSMFESNGIKILTVPGQHDMRYHTSDLRNTPMGVLEAAGAIEVAYPKGGAYHVRNDSVCVYGVGWGQKIPEKLNDLSSCNILLTHRMVINKKLWEGQTDYQFGAPLLENHPFDLIVTGDNHQHLFFVNTEGNHNRFLINCGSLMRSSIDQIDHEPYVYIYNTESKDAKPIIVPVKPISEVMRVDEAQQEKERNEKLEAFVEGLRDESEIEGLDFIKNLDEYISSTELSQEIKDIIGEIING